MTLVEALKCGKPFKRKEDDEVIYYYEPGTGPHSDLVGCDYFVFDFKGIKNFSTSIDLYASDILADDWEIYESI